ncbi:ATP-grasp domain-containing protein [Otariodibacter oris]|uniref:SSU ribosomal protein S6P modification protein n=1 Tax=Otariodibacter oris TaxID=1032623 RepID=A0A420XIL5_9PAST|nr:RimK family alpha-L-glutamate ligase [Otariodibacter oris]QGM80830.1 ribosomal protein S6 modification protein [Otariodibacter oris]RKR76998.1 SSU ribosomal protein S6P modification protein [Otariodibacter oris]
MKLLMLCREPRLYSCQRLKQESEQLGFEMDILDPNRFSLHLLKGQFQCYYQLGESYDKNRPLPQLVDHYSAIIPRFGTTSTEMGCYVLSHFEAQQIPVLNSSQSFKFARDKWQSLQLLAAANLPVPDTAFTGDLFSNTQAVKSFTPSTIIKTLAGSQGVGVMLSENERSTVSLLDTLRGAKVKSLLQKYIKEASGQDIRAFVIGDKVVATMVRFGASGEFRANIHQGGHAEIIELTEQEQEIAIKATKILGLDVAGVDLIRSQTGTMILEVNASPGLEMIEKVSGVNIAKLMIQNLCKKIA